MAFHLECPGLSFNATPSRKPPLTSHPSSHPHFPLSFVAPRLPLTLDHDLRIPHPTHGRFTRLIKRVTGPTRGGRQITPPCPTTNGHGFVFLAPLAADAQTWRQLSRPRPLATLFACPSPTPSRLPAGLRNSETCLLVPLLPGCLPGAEPILPFGLVLTSDLCHTYDSQDHLKAVKRGDCLELTLALGILGSDGLCCSLPSLFTS